jgi:hypothetical protein
VGKRALMAYQRYAHAKQFRRANRALRSVRTYLGRVFRDVVRKTKGDANLRKVFAAPLSLAFRVRHQIAIRRPSLNGRDERESVAVNALLPFLVAPGTEGMR